MTQRRKAETPKARAWHGSTAAGNRLDEDRRWVVWGTGPREVDPLRTANQGDDIAEGIVRGRDPEWADSDDPQRWMVVIHADEDDIDAWVMQDPSAIGFAPHLITSSNDERPADLVRQEVEHQEASPQPQRRSGPASKSSSRTKSSAPSSDSRTTSAARGMISRVVGSLPITPRAEMHEGELKIFAGAHLPDVPLFAEAGPHPVIVRMARTVGLPDRTPDLLSLSVKIRDVDGEGMDQDIVMFSSAPVRLGRNVALPARDFRSTTFSTLVPHKVAGSLLLFGAVPAAGGDRPEESAFRFVVASPIGGWRDAGVLYLGDRMQADAEVRFDPWTAGQGISPMEAVSAVRRVVRVAVGLGRGG